MITFTDEQAIAIFDAVSDDDTYTAQAIFSQVWEAPYNWFRLTSGTDNLIAAPTVAEVHENQEVILDHQFMTETQIKTATIRNYFANIAPFNTPDARYRRSLYQYLVDLDANDVDAILQFAMFGQIRYS